ncbi:MAG: hypothetical protein QNK23_05225 [Crocinitomicaceae bacterium]|nr:hypothetical protein [Crocinitomicaceae bacterium]
MEGYKITDISQEEVGPTINCLEENGIVLTLENEQTASLITEMQTDYSKESRKLWMLCQNIDDGVISSH